MQRRTTLSQLSSNNVNSRASLGPARVSSAKPPSKRMTMGPANSRGSSLGLSYASNQNSKMASSQNHRQSGSTRSSLGTSMMRTNPSAKQQTAPVRSSLYSSRPSSVGRRSSAYGKPGGKRRDDPRPISDRAFMNTSIRTLIRYLTEQGFEQAVSMKTISTPSSKDFLNILLFLYRKVDPYFKYSARPEDDVPVMFRRLKYPFQINKSALLAVGSPHTWPSLLAALLWLVELLVCEEEAALARGEAEGGMEGENGDKVFFDYLASAYSSFLAGVDEDGDGMQQELNAGFEAKNKQAEAEIAHFQQENVVLEEQIGELEALKTRVPELQTKKTDFLSDIEKFKKLIKNLEAHEETLLKKKAEVEAEAQRQAAEFELTQQLRNELQATVDSQDLSPADVQRINAEKLQLKSTLETLTPQREETEKLVWEREMAVSKKLTHVEKIISSFKDLAENLEIIPETAANAHGMNFDISLNPNATDPAKQLTGDLTHTITPYACKLKDSFHEQSHDVQLDMVQVQERAEEVEEICAQRMEKVDSLEARIKKLEGQYRHDKELLAEKLREYANDNEVIDAEVERLRLSGSEDLQCAKKNLAAKQLDYDQAVRACLKEKESINERVLSTLDALAAHKATINDTLSRLSRTSAQLANDVMVRSHTRPLL